MTQENKQMTKDMIFIIVVFGIIAAIIECIFVKNILYSLGGLFTGCILAIYMFVYMNIVLHRSISFGDSKAIERYIVKHSIIRYLTVVVVFFVLCITEIADPISCFIGLLGLKVSAYLQPSVNKLRKTKKEVDT